jgi:hypothetical protein
MRIRTTLIAGLGLLALAGCADPYANPAASGTTTTSVTRDAYGNPIASSTTVRDAYGNVVAAQPSGGAYPAPGYPNQPAYGNAGAVARAQDPNCRATPLHQDRPGGSDYNPYRGAPSC